MEIKMAFLTGSRAYGNPREDSDVDLVILTNTASLIALERVSDPNPPPKQCGDSAYEGRHLVFGKLNLIVTTEPEMYGAWLEGTIKLMEEAPVSRDRAVEVLSELRGSAAETISIRRLQGA